MATEHCAYCPRQNLASPTSPQFRVKRERRALQPLFPSDAAELLSKSEGELAEEPSVRLPEAAIAEAAEGEEGDEQDSASVTSSDYSHEEDGDSNADDGRSNFGLDDDADKSAPNSEEAKGALQDEEDEGDVTMRLRELSKTPSAETPDRLRKVSNDAQTIFEKPEEPKQATNNDEDYLSELSEDEAFAASLA